MEHNPEVVTICQGPPATPNQGGARTHTNPELAPIQAVPPEGQGNPNTSETSGNTRRNHGRGGDCSNSKGTMHGVGGVSIRDWGRWSEVVDNVGDTGKGPRHTMMG